MIDIKKKYQTRDGREVRIYATDGYGTYFVHGAVLTEEGWFPRCWTEQGELSHARLAHSAHDLIEVRPRHKVSVWINTYGATVSGGLYSTRESADEAAVSKRTGCIKVELDFEEGEGL
jgi:hypothetical protein